MRWEYPACAGEGERTAAGQASVCQTMLFGKEFGDDAAKLANNLRNYSAS